MELLDESLIEASWGGRFTKIKLLLFLGANVNAGGDLPVIKATQWNCVQIVKYLIKKGANPENRPELDALNAVQWAAFFGHLDLIKLFREEQGIKGYDDYILSCTTKSNHREVLQYLSNVGVSNNKG